MNSCILILSLAVFGASAGPCCGIVGGLNSGIVGGLTSGVVGGLSSGVVGGLSSGVVGGLAGGCGLGGGLVGGVAPCSAPLPGPTSFGVAPCVQTANVLPAIVPSTSVSKSCHCMKTIVRPQLRHEVITAPSVDHIVRYVTSPVVEVASVNCGGATRGGVVPSCGTAGVVGGLNSGIIGGGLGYNGIMGGGLIGSGVVGTGLVGSGLVGGCGAPIVGGCGASVVGGCATPVVGGCGSPVVC